MSKIRQALDGGPIYMAGIRKELKAMVNEYDRLKSELDALRKDAERYRWLRMCQPTWGLESEFWTVEGDDCDQLVDQEMEKCRTT